MNTTETPYDPRYLAGIVLFNRGDFFEAHEVWESWWMDTFGPEKTFVKGLIQAAVGLCHFCNGNMSGALKLYRSSREYMLRYGSPYLGLNQTAFWQQMDGCFAEMLAVPQQKHEIHEELIPTLELDPPPSVWPDPQMYLDEE
jgi:uncharacterized protein